MNRCCEPDCNLDELSDGRCYAHARMHIIDEMWGFIAFLPLALLLGFGGGLVGLLAADHWGLISL